MTTLEFIQMLKGSLDTRYSKIGEGGTGVVNETQVNNLIAQYHTDNPNVVSPADAITQPQVDYLLALANSTAPVIPPNQILNIAVGDYREVIDLVTNGTFDTDLTGWESTGYTIEHYNNALRFSVTSSNIEYVYSVVTVIEAGNYELSFDLISSYQAFNIGYFRYGVTSGGLGTFSNVILHNNNTSDTPRRITLSNITLAVGDNRVFFSNYGGEHVVDVVVDNITLIKV